MASPSMTTSNSAGNLLASTTLAASGTNSTTNLDASAKFEAQVQISCTFGSVAATAGVQINVYRRIGSGPANDTVPMNTILVTAVGSTTAKQSFALQTGRYNITLINLDSTNSVTGVTLTDDTIDGVI
jgi:hypothetical protein